MIDMVVTNLCSYADTGENIDEANSYWHADPSEQENITALMISNHLSSPLKLLVRRTTSVFNAFENGLLEPGIKQSDFAGLRNMGSRRIRDCVSNKIVYPDHDILFPNVGHYRHLFWLSGLALTFCCPFAHFRVDR